jgi:hypothetical protein
MAFWWDALRLGRAAMMMTWENALVLMRLVGFIQRHEFHNTFNYLRIPRYMM